MVAYGNERNYRTRKVYKVNGKTQWPITEHETWTDEDGERHETLSDAFYDAALTWSCAFADSEEVGCDEITMEDGDLRRLYESVHTTGHGSMHLKWTARDPEDLCLVDMEVDYTIDVVD